jgi:hypothetical protein
LAKKPGLCGVSGVKPAAGASKRARLWIKRNKLGYLADIRAALGARLKHDRSDGNRRARARPAMAIR